jgi:hypothetical protein
MEYGQNGIWTEGKLKSKLEENRRRNQEARGDQDIPCALPASQPAATVSFGVHREVIVLFRKSLKPDDGR